MIATNFKLFTLMVVLAASSAAPSNDGTPIGYGKDIKLPLQCKDQPTCVVKPEGYDGIVPKINDALLTHPVNNVKFQVQAALESTTTEKVYDDIKEEVLSPSSDWHNCPYITRRERLYMYHHGNETNIIIQTPMIAQYVTTVRCAFEMATTTMGGNDNYQTVSCVKQS